MQWGPEARLAACQAAFGLLDGGRLCLYAGERKAAELTASLIDLTPDQALAAVAELRRADPTFDAAFRRAAPIRTPSRTRKKKR